MGVEEQSQFISNLQLVFQEVLRAAKEVVPEVPDYKLALDDYGCCVDWGDGVSIKFYVLSLGATGGEGATERNHEWVGFGKAFDTAHSRLAEPAKKWLQFAMTWTRLQHQAHGLPR